MFSLRQRSGSLLHAARPSPAQFTPSTPMRPVLRRLAATDATSVSPPRVRPDFRPRAKKGGNLMLLFPLATFSLGCWQLWRLQWKNDLIARATTNVREKPAIRVDDAQAAAEVFAPGSEKQLEYRRISVRGRFDTHNDIFIGPRPTPISEEDPGWVDAQKAAAAPLVAAGEATSSAELVALSNNTGWMVVTPLVVEGQAQADAEAAKAGKPLTPFLLAIRGYIPKFARVAAPVPRYDPPTAADDLGAAVSVECLARRPENNFLGAMVPNKTDRGEWTWMEKDELRRWFGLGKEGEGRDMVILEMVKTPQNTPYYRRLSSDPNEVSPYPRSLDNVLTFKNKHFGYSMTWFSLSAVSLAFWYARKGGSGKFKLGRGIR